MKSLNPIKFVSNAVEDLARYQAQIEAAETFKNAEVVSKAMYGYLDCLDAFTDTMAGEENLDFTSALGETLEDWRTKMYQALVIKAHETQQPEDVIRKLLHLRDEHATSC